MTPDPCRTNENRFRLAWVTPEVLFDLFVDGRRTVRIIGTVPREARLVRAFYDERRAQIGLVYEHESFDIVEPGRLIPEADQYPVFERVDA